MTSKKDVTYEVAGVIITHERLKEIAQDKTPSPKLGRMNKLLKELEKNKANEKFLSQFR